MASGNIIVIKPSKDYEKVPGEVIRNFDVETIGMYCKLLSFGHAWQLNVKGLSSTLGVSAPRVRKALTTLEESGYLVRKPHQENDGRMSGWDYYIYGHCVEAEARSSAGLSNIRLTEKPTTRSTDNTENREDIIYRLKSNNRLINSDRLKDNMVKPFNFRESLIEIGVSEEVADAYMQVRKLKRAANTEIAFSALRREINKTGKTANDCVTICVENSWSGFKAEWLNKPRQSSEASRPKDDWFHHNIEVGKRLGIIPDNHGK